MTIIILPNLNCNIKCKYCFAYEYGWVPLPNYNLPEILKSMKILHEQTKGDGLCLHGGECTLIPFKDLETLVKQMYDLQKRGAIQTNGYKISQEMINLFKTHNVNVGVSIDGIGNLNSLRGFPDNHMKNKKYTDKVLSNMVRLRKEGIDVGVITLLHKENAGDYRKLEKLYEFILMLQTHNINGGRLNLMWTNRPEIKPYELTPDEASRAWLYLYDHLKVHNKLQWNPFREFVDNLLGLSHASCSMGKCDYFCTIGAKAILPDGSFGNCDRTHQEGAIYTRASENPSYERYEVLKETDCKDCRYWQVCYGGCPAEGADSDWRNKTRFCKAVYNLYSAIETDMRNIFPNISLVTDYRGDYFDDHQKGTHINPFSKMLYERSFNPSSWKSVRMREKQC